MAKFRCNEKEIRDNDLFVKYGEVLKKYGELSRDLSKKKIYSEVAAHFYMTWETAARIINKKQKERHERRTFVPL